MTTLMQMTTAFGTSGTQASAGRTAIGGLMMANFGGKTSFGRRMRRKNRARRVH